MPKATYNLQPLIDHLLSLSVRETTMSIAEVERLTGPLPMSASKYPQWWENGAETGNRPQRRAMAKAGLKTFFSPTSGNVRFERDC